MDHIVVNPDKSQAMIMSSDKKENKYELNINNSIIISSVDSVTLSGIEIDNKLNFEKHVSTIISFYIFLSRQYSVMYIYIYIYICILKMFLNICFFYPRIKKVIYIIIVA